MLGDDLRAWFELFHGMIVYRPQAEGGHGSDGWLNWADLERRFKSERLTFAGKPYDASDSDERNKLLDAIINYAGTFTVLRLLERRRQIIPPSLDYRVTQFGRRVGNWGFGDKPGFRKRAFFFVAACVLRAHKYRWLIAVGAAGWAAVNAVKFYTAALSWIGGLPFAAWSAAALAILAAVWALAKAKLG